MPTKHVISQADELFWGKARYAPLQGILGRTGMRIDPIVKWNLGTPDTADANGVVESQDLTALGVFSVDTTAAAAIAAAALAGVMDVPRNIVAAWTGTAVITITGTDAYDNVLVESSASGTSLAGKKAFKTVNNVSVSADVTALTVGTGNVLGLPICLDHERDVLAFYADTTEEKLAATFVAAVTSVATATTGDVRGTVTPNTTPNGSVVMYIWMGPKGVSLSSDLVGVTQYGG